MRQVILNVSLVQSHSDPIILPMLFLCLHICVILGMLGMCRTVFHENPTEGYSQELVFSNFLRAVLVNESTHLYLSYKTLRARGNMFLWTCHSTPSTSDLFVTKLSLPWYHSRRKLFLAFAGCRAVSNTTIFSNKMQCFSTGVTSFPINIHVIYGKQLQY